MTVVVDGEVERGAFRLQARLRLEPGTVVAVLGPNGSGKTTLLRAIAGLEALTRGRIDIDGRTVDDGDSTFVDARARSVGMVFQDYALFPHLSVRDNVAFGPRARGAGARRSRELAEAALARLGAADLAGRRPADISGGQAQRVALARALATEPDVLLLDEPTAALDIATRDAVRAELAAHLAGYRGCTLLVSHEPLDALLLADRVVVLEDGRVVQEGVPADLARRPATPYVAALMGVTLLRGTATDGVVALEGGGTLHTSDTAARGPVLCVIRPESVTVHRHRPEGSARNVWPATITSVQPSHDRVRIVADGQPGVTVVVTPAAVADLGLLPGVEVWLSMKAVDLAVHPAATPPA